MGSTAKKHVEVEDKEILIKSSNGYMAIIPKSMAPWVREHIDSGNHHIVDGYVKGLQEMKDGGKAQDGGTIKPPSNVIASDALKVNRFPIPPETDMRRPIVQDQPLKTHMVRGIKEVGDLIGVKSLKKGGHPNETYSDVVYRLSHTPGTSANVIEKKYPKGLSVLSGAGEALLDPINALPIGSWAGSGLKYLGVNASKIPKLAATLFRMGKLAPVADFLTTANDAKVANDEYVARPEPENKPLTKGEQALINRMTKKINQQKIVR